MATKTVKKKTIEEKYKELNELDHILLRPSMWVGSVKEELAQFFIFDESENKMIMQEVTYIPAMLKIVDEVISNSCDEYRRPTNLGLNKLSVTINKDDLSIIVYDNGGILFRTKDYGHIKCELGGIYQKKNANTVLNCIPNLQKRFIK